MAKYIWINAQNAINPRYVVRAHTSGNENDCEILLQMTDGTSHQYKRIRGQGQGSQLVIAERELQDLVRNSLEPDR